MAKRLGRRNGVRRVSGAGPGYDRKSSEPEGEGTTDEHPEIPARVDRRGPHEVLVQLSHGKYLAFCLKCGVVFASHRMLPSILDDAVAHGRVVKVTGAGRREEEIWQMINKRRRLRRFRVF